ncbi:MBL fold metallo-hydrolase [Undibacterium cyanobacteriorum]|uniref:MBL fold metallo-hydrolase n=1 Tax=Undibacterium cyanobacteriorum TaxID=3073561 RepID=A0ABY9RFU5_9BURK|nr:MBL fold metallo-hydrolase [Undibacterium sp. 20NA77.5]WMW79729.1 MBL fold metallo-hydrolase [Undibacterium sp. 20NA77.5]
MDKVKHELEQKQSASGKFDNQRALREPGFGKGLKIIWDFFFNKPKNTVPSGSIPVMDLSREDLLTAPDNTLYRLGHSSLLLKLHGAFFLLDPVFSERASPFQWMGPRRFHAPPISIEQLPPIKAVILSHDHYDHLDYAAVLALDTKVEHFITPSGVGDRLIKWGISANKIQQLTWWQSTQVAGVELIATPAQHFSGRGLNDRNKTLWASWTILAQDLRVFFSGDSGYFAGFKEIGKRFGPFDLTLIETGAYNEQWPDVHMQPEESLQAHLDLQGKTMLPIHNGTFDLAMHAWYEPFERIIALADTAKVRISTPMMGEPVDLSEAQRGQAWWRTPLAAPVKRGYCPTRAKVLAG